MRVRPTPPDSGTITPSSAYTKAMASTITAPRAQEITAAGPASLEAFKAPNSQPDPMIEPMLANSSPTIPICRLSWGSSVAVVEVSLALRDSFAGGQAWTAGRSAANPRILLLLVSGTKQALNVTNRW